MPALSRICGLLLNVHPIGLWLIWVSCMQQAPPSLMLTKTDFALLDLVYGGCWTEETRWAVDDSMHAGGGCKNAQVWNGPQNKWKGVACPRDQLLFADSMWTTNLLQPAFPQHCGCIWSKNRKFGCMEWRIGEWRVGNAHALSSVFVSICFFGVASSLKWIQAMDRYADGILYFVTNCLERWDPWPDSPEERWEHSVLRWKERRCSISWGLFELIAN